MIISYLNVFFSSLFRWFNEWLYDQFLGIIRCSTVKSTNTCVKILPKRRHPLDLNINLLLRIIKIYPWKCIFQNFHILSFQDAPANHIGASNKATIRFVTNANNTAIWRAQFQVSTQNGAWSAKDKRKTKFYSNIIID